MVAIKKELGEIDAEKKNLQNVEKDVKKNVAAEFDEKKVEKDWIDANKSVKRLQLEVVENRKEEKLDFIRIEMDKVLGKIKSSLISLGYPKEELIKMFTELSQARKEQQNGMLQ